MTDVYGRTAQTSTRVRILPLDLIKEVRPWEDGDDQCRSSRPDRQWASSDWDTNPLAGFARFHSSQGGNAPRSPAMNVLSTSK